MVPRWARWAASGSLGEGAVRAFDEGRSPGSVLERRRPAKATRRRAPSNMIRLSLYCAALRGTARGWRLSLRFFTASNIAGKLGRSI